MTNHRFIIHDLDFTFPAVLLLAPVALLLLLLFLVFGAFFHFCNAVEEPDLANTECFDDDGFEMCSSFTECMHV